MFFCFLFLFVFFPAVKQNLKNSGKQRMCDKILNIKSSPILFFHLWLQNFWWVLEPVQFSESEHGMMGTSYKHSRILQPRGFGSE